MNLSSIVIQTNPENLNKVLQTVKSSPDCEYHIHDEKGRIIVTIEGKNTEEEIGKLKKLQAIPHVITAEMAFAYSEDELEQEREKLEKSKDNIPEWLNDPDTKIRDINYGGDLKGKF
ncbi:MAG: nitrate reductase [Bacteroidetes bacterium]|nr:MAG: nitrate reductase [Bacteroidota bacterium]